MHRILAIDAGGTCTRAVILDHSGHCWGFGSAGGGNPVSVGLESALASLDAATAGALAGGPAGAPTFSSAFVAMAGAGERVPLDRIADRLAPLGLRGEVAVDSDLLATFYSGTFRPHGYALVAGTGAVAARIIGGRLDRVAGGAGWLVGDAGSGYWIGHQVARAVVAALDGRAPGTALTTLLLASLQLEATSERSQGRPAVLLPLITALYALRPVELARFAPLAFQVHGDPVAGRILAAAAAELVDLLGAVYKPTTGGPVVLGGSVLCGARRGGGMLADTSPFAAILARRLGHTEFLPVPDGVVGAAVLGLMRAGVRVDAEMFQRIRQDVTWLRTTSRTDRSYA